MDSSKFLVSLYTRLIAEPVHTFHNEKVILVSLFKQPSRIGGPYSKAHKLLNLREGLINRARDMI
jgi:hypothetical protein